MARNYSNENILKPWLNKLGFTERKSPDFYFSSDFPEKHLYSFYLRELKLLGIDAAYFIGDLPIILFKTYDSFYDKDEIKELHKKLWNQSIAPVIILTTRDELRVYSNINKPAAEHEDLDDGKRLVKVLNKYDPADEFFKLYVNQFESGNFFREYSSNFDPEQRVDRYLLKQLGNIRTALKEEGLSDEVAYTLVGRCIFITYLLDREVLNEDYFNEFGVCNYVELISKLDSGLVFNFFNKIKNDFNGDIFPRNDEAEDSKSYFLEQKQIKPKSLSLLSSFLKGEDLETGQQRFWPYNFRYIPIEMISGVYEQFLGGFKETRRQTGSYYTPRFLADIVINTAFSDIRDYEGIKILDPSCGSGIFLVGAYRRIIEQWRISRNRRPSAKTLIKILKESIWGVDINKVACQIASFSLYLTMLDYLEPRDIIGLKEQGLKLPILVGENLFEANYFAEDCKIDRIQFDLVIGNPPWASAKGIKNEHEKWCKKREFPISDRNIAQAFVWKAGIHKKAGGSITLLLPAGLLFNHSPQHRKFIRSWFDNYSIEQIINLTDLRHFLFSDAIGPGIIVKYKEKKKLDEKGYVEYISPKSEPSWLNVELLPLSPEDFKIISIDSLYRDPLIWKKAFWGTNRDRKLIQRLEEYETLDKIISERKWIYGRGFQRKGKNQREYKQLIGKNEIVRLTPYVVPRSSLKAMTLNSVLLHRHGIFEIYEPSHVLISRGISSRYGKKKIISAFSSEYLVFKNSITAVKGNKSDDDLLKLLTIILNSDISSYFYFHTAANFGVWHDEVRVDELLRFPFPLHRVDTKIIQKANGLLNEFEELKNDLLYDALKYQRLEKEVNNLAYEFYDLTNEEKFLIEDDINLTIPSVQPSRRTRREIKLLKKVTERDINKYLTVLLETLNYWLENTSTRIRGKIIKSGMPFSIVKLIIHDDKHKGDHNKDTMDFILNRIYGLLPRKITRNLYLLRNLRIFDNECLYIAKPNKNRDWTCTAALNDADNILIDIESNITKSI